MLKRSKFFSLGLLALTHNMITGSIVTEAERSLAEKAQNRQALGHFDGVPNKG